MKVIISGGGTGGHIFPAIAIANELKNRVPDVEILFVGATGRMEMERIPAAGYRIVGLPIRGFQRKLSLRNVSVIARLAISLLKANTLLKTFQPDVAVGVGGYASGALLYQASKRGIPCLVQEQNSYPGITNKLLAKRVSTICVAYDGMNRYFPSDKLVLTGNPVRREVVSSTVSKEEACEHFHLNPRMKTILVVGGSLGAGTINKAVAQSLNRLGQSNVQVVWQTGKNYYPEMRGLANGYKNVHVYDFISRMDAAFAAADIIITRAGASTISELCLVGKPCIFVPSPNVAEDHQTKNALALVEKHAAHLVTDANAEATLITKAIELLNDIEEQNRLSTNILTLGKNDAAARIVDEILKIAKR